MAEKDITIEQVDLVALFESVRTYVLAAGSTASVVFGRPELTKQANQGTGGANRIVFVPGDLSGKGGQLVGGTGKKFPYRVAGWLEFFTVHIWGHDASTPQSDAKHFRAHRELRKLVVNALENELGARVQFLEAEWITTPVERVYGCACAYVFSLEDVVLSLPLATIPAHPAEQPTVTATFVPRPGAEELIAD